MDTNLPYELITVLLRWLLASKNQEGQMTRWVQILSTYDMEIKHRTGLNHKNADSLSRYPCLQCGYTYDWDQENPSMCRSASYNRREKYRN
jgi:hypothetical protein